MLKCTKNGESLSCKVYVTSIVKVYVISITHLIMQGIRYKYKLHKEHIGDTAPYELYICLYKDKEGDTTVYELYICLYEGEHIMCKLISPCKLSKLQSEPPDQHPRGMGKSDNFTINPPPLDW